MRNGDDAYQVIFNAASVISLDKQISKWMGENDPQALAQLREAIKAVQIEIDQRTALAALAEKFDNIREITFVTQAQEGALLDLLEQVAGTLSLRGRSRLTQKLGADTVRVLAKYHADVLDARAATLVGGVDAS